MTDPRENERICAASQTQRARLDTRDVPHEALVRFTQRCIGIEPLLARGADHIEQKLAEELGFFGLTTADHVITPATIDSTYPYAPDGKA